MNVPNNLSPVPLKKYIMALQTVQTAYSASLECLRVDVLPPIVDRLSSEVNRLLTKVLDYSQKTMVLSTEETRTALAHLVEEIDRALLAIDAEIEEINAAINTSICPEDGQRMLRAQLDNVEAERLHTLRQMVVDYKASLVNHVAYRASAPVQPPVQQRAAPNVEESRDVLTSSDLSTRDTNHMLNAYDNQARPRESLLDAQVNNSYDPHPTMSSLGKHSLEAQSLSQSPNKRIPSIDGILQESRHQQGSNHEQTGGVTQTIHHELVEGDHWIFPYPQTSSSYYVILCESLDENPHVFKRDPWAYKRAKNHFYGNDTSESAAGRRTRTKDNCSHSLLPGMYDENEIMRRYGYRVVTVDGKDVTEDWVKRSNDRLSKDLQPKVAKNSNGKANEQSRYPPTNSTNNSPPHQLMPEASPPNYIWIDDEDSNYAGEYTYAPIKSDIE